MTLSDISIKNPVFGWMLMIGIIVFGWIGYTRMGVSQLPDVDFPVVTVTVTWEGAAPEIMETEVTDFIEDAVMSVEGIKEDFETSIPMCTLIGYSFLAVAGLINRLKRLFGLARIGVQQVHCLRAEFVNF